MKIRWLALCVVFVFAVGLMACKDGGVPVVNFEISTPIDTLTLTPAGTSSAKDSVMGGTANNSFDVVEPGSMAKPTFMIFFDNPDENGDEESDDTAILANTLLGVSCTTSSSFVTVVKSEVIREKDSSSAVLDIQYSLPSSAQSLNETCTVTLSYTDGSNKVEREIAVVWPQVDNGGGSGSVNASCVTNSDCAEGFECDTGFKQCMPKIQGVSVDVSKSPKGSHIVTVSWKHAKVADGSALMKPEYIEIFEKLTQKSVRFSYGSLSVDEPTPSKIFEFESSKSGHYYAVVSPTLTVDNAKKVSMIKSDPADFWIPISSSTEDCNSHSECEPLQICSKKSGQSSGKCTLMQTANSLNSCSIDNDCNTHYGYVCNKMGLTGSCVPKIKEIFTTPEAATGYTKIVWTMGHPNWTDGLPIQFYSVTLTAADENNQNTSTVIIKTTVDEMGLILNLQKDIYYAKVCPVKKEGTATITYPSACYTTGFEVH